MKKFINLLIIIIIAVGIMFPLRKFLKNNFVDNKGENSLIDENKQNDNDKLDSIGQEEEENEEDIAEEDPLADTVFLNDDGLLILTNTDDVLVLVNKKRNLPGTYKPTDLVVPNVRFSFDEIIEKRHLRQEAALALEEMFNAAENEDNIILYAVSGYRSYDRQKTLFDNKKNQVGEEEARLVVAYPGQSEHQTGLTIDISAKSVGFSLETSFGKTKEGIWVKENAHRFGYIIRYEEDTTEITGYSFEPWHIRYVGIEAATEIFERKVTLEEYLGDA